MANALNDHVLIVDTADAANVAVGGVVLNEEVRVKTIRWVGTAATAAGHTAVVQNGDGKDMWDDIATGANYRHESRLDLRFTHGVRVTTLSSGKLYFYYVLDSQAGR